MGGGGRCGKDGKKGGRRDRYKEEERVGQTVGSARLKRGMNQRVHLVSCSVTRPPLLGHPLYPSSLKFRLASAFVTCPSNKGWWISAFLFTTTDWTGFETRVKFCRQVHKAQQGSNWRQFYYHSTSIFTPPISSALGIVSVKMPSANFAFTLAASAGRGNQTVRENLELPVNDRSTES